MRAPRRGTRCPLLEPRVIGAVTLDVLRAIVGAARACATSMAQIIASDDTDTWTAVLVAAQALGAYHACRAALWPVRAVLGAVARGTTYPMRYVLRTAAQALADLDEERARNVEEAELELEDYRARQRSAREAEDYRAWLRSVREIEDYRARLRSAPQVDFVL